VGGVTCGPVALVLGSEEPAFAISYLAPIGAWDSGYMVVFSDAPDPEDVEDDDAKPVCLNCLIDDHPEIGRGLDLAREHGGADLDENGEWVVGDPTFRPTCARPSSASS
jgi:hypothetical protein